MAYYLKTVKPDFDAGAATGSAYSDNDILFTWTKFDIPKGPASLRSIHCTMAGTNGAAGNTHDIGLYFARAIDGAAPASFGTIHAATTALLSNAFRRNIIGFKKLDLTQLDDTDHLIAYNVLGSQEGNAAGRNENMNMVLQGDDNKFVADGTYSATPQGYQSIWVAAIAHGGFDFGTDIQLNQVGHQAAATIPTTITIEQGGAGAGVANNSFQKGDILIGATGGPTMEITDMVSGTATSLIVKNISEQIDNNEELSLQYPLELHLGFEY